MHSSGNAEGTEGTVRRVLKGGRRENEIRRKAGERKAGREKMPKKESSGGKESETTETAFEETKGGPCAGNCHLGSSRDQLVTNLNPIRLICASPTGSPISRPPRKVVGLALPTRCDELTSQVSLNWAPH
jgi:hypothetical protein